MNTGISEKSANLRVKIIGIFYLISGAWELLLGMEYESVSDLYLNLRREYVMLFGMCTIIVGIGILMKKNIFRKLALILAWWNLFTSPLLGIWVTIYVINMRKLPLTMGPFEVVTWTFLILFSMTAARIYIIYMLRTQKAGYIFLEKNT